MILGHVIALDPTPKQANYFRRACGTARFAYNWGLAEWERIRASGEQPFAQKIKILWNDYRIKNLPWSYEVTKCASNQAILDLGAAFNNFFRDCKKPKGQRKFRYPRFKRKRLNEGFALWNDQFELDGKRVRIPILGWVEMREALRFDGKIMGARISFSGGRWFLSVQVETDVKHESAPEGSVVGVDLGVTTLATLSTGEKIEGPKPRKRLLGSVRRMQRRISLQKHRAKKLKEKASRRQFKRQMRLSRLHARLSNRRKDAAHKLTSSLTSRFQTVVIEDLNVSGMSKNHALAGAILDCGFYEIRRQLDYKAEMRNGRVVVVDRFFPSSKLCSHCGFKVEMMPLSVREWLCINCGEQHDRDVNAAKNLEQIGQARAELTHGDKQPLSSGKPTGKQLGRTVNQGVSTFAHV
jgi:putative transposase